MHTRQAGEFLDFEAIDEDGCEGKTRREEPARELEREPIWEDEEDRAMAKKGDLAMAEG